MEETCLESFQGKNNLIITIIHKRGICELNHTIACRDRQIELCNQAKHSDLKPNTVNLWT
jgi:hypothetical protein